MNDWPTRFTNGNVVSRGVPKFRWVRFNSQGKIHYVEHVIFRWNFMGGTREKPDVTIVLTCGPQLRQFFHAPKPDIHNPICSRCDSVMVRKGIALEP